jgi:Utp13 specific WD40 associated domain
MSIDAVCEMAQSRDLVEALIAYTEKHLARAKKLGVTSNLVGYTLDMMDRL